MPVPAPRRPVSPREKQSAPYWQPEPGKANAALPHVAQARPATATTVAISASCAGLHCAKARTPSLTAHDHRTGKPKANPAVAIPVQVPVADKARPSRPSSGIIENKATSRSDRSTGSGHENLPACLQRPDGAGHQKEPPRCQNHRQHRPSPRPHGQMACLLMAMLPSRQRTRQGPGSHARRQIARPRCCLHGHRIGVHGHIHAANRAAKTPSPDDDPETGWCTHHQNNRDTTSATAQHCTRAIASIDSRRTASRSAPQPE